MPRAANCFVLTGLAVLALASAARPARAFDCAPPPPGPRDIKAMGYYSDGAKSVVDPKLFAENRAMTRPLDEYESRVSHMSDLYLRGDAEAGACAARWLDRWASDSALLGQMVHVNNDQADYLRQWLHAGLAVAYLKVMPAAQPDQRERIGAWLKAVTVQSLAYWDNPRKSRNNHYYWTGVGVMATAVATGDTQVLARARMMYREGVDDIAEDGSLPLEMKRAGRAFHYHDYALQPLVMMAEMAGRIGEDWYAYRDWRIDRLADRVAAGYRDSSWFAAKSGSPQAAEDVKPSIDTGWVEFYRLRAPRPARFDDLHKAGPYDNPRSGGDLSLMASLGFFRSAAGRPPQGAGAP
jgi:poly(beta-D-mannuronate) lyase